MQTAFPVKFVLYLISANVACRYIVVTNDSKALFQAVPIVSVKHFQKSFYELQQVVLPWVMNTKR